MVMILSGSSTGFKLTPMRPGWPPGLFLVPLFLPFFFLLGSLEGGLLLLRLFKDKRPESNVIIVMSNLNIAFSAGEICLSVSSNSSACLRVSVILRFFIFMVLTLSEEHKDSMSFKTFIFALLERVNPLIKN